ncbi:hypothetical protein HF086_002506 [Spodoptera exigua]|uniref:alanine transaminase n=1 Tax=Spodoptera exigua TaxID=7107 RepID=A0A922SJ88_SPOEX|nr:hypothetical protein HF086_002506 [Spodoptera exigua]
MSQIKLISRASRVLSVSGVGVRSEFSGKVLLQLQGNHTSARTMTSSQKKTLTLETMNPNITKLEYAVRGPLVMRASEIEKELEKGAKKPFKQVIKANIGDAHAMGQQPITFIRQVLACVSHPDLLSSDHFPSDVKERAKAILGACGGMSVGSYTMSHGIELIRRHVAEYIERRDGQKANWEDVCLTGGASSGIKSCLQLLCKKVDGKDSDDGFNHRHLPPIALTADSNNYSSVTVRYYLLLPTYLSSVLIPIPQYPLYSASLAEYGLGQIGYYLDEDNNWALDVKELERAFQEGSKTHAVRAIVLTRQNIEDIIKFAHKHSLFLFADEVYQDNVYGEGSKFFSFKKVMRELGAPYESVELASFMSISKGYMGECGLRGGWMELCNLDAGVQANLYKAISAMLCPTTLGQTAVDCVARPPMPGEPSYDLWHKEKTTILQSLSERAKTIADTFNTMKGFNCNVVQGSMYAFPRVDLPPKAIEAAKAVNQHPDVFYAFRLLEETGICVVPGSGFGQRPNTYHFRTTILPQPKQLQEMLEIFKAFQEKFTKEYS